MIRALLAPLALALILAACSKQATPPPITAAPGADADGHVPPEPATVQANTAAAAMPGLADTQDMADAMRGLVGEQPVLNIKADDGRLIWTTADFGFLNGTASASVNPSLWRQAQLNNVHGLFEVAPGIHQLRGFDISNMMLIDGASGWIVIDPLTARETAAAAIAYAREKLGDKPISAIVYTHSHVDHFGGVLGIVSAEDAAARALPIVAPEGFLEEATSENVLAGTTMGRRAEYMYGRHLAHSERGHVDTGLGKGPAFGSPGLLVPTQTVHKTGEELTLDGVRFQFLNAPASEAPAEFMFYLPDMKAFCGAEVVSHTMHNLYTLRGAKVRDALRWSGYIDEAMRSYPEAEVYFASHHWPLWGTERIKGFLAGQRDTYRFIHDQTLRLASQGLTSREIAEQMKLPASLAKDFWNHGYYGTVKHNAKAVYQFYFGWYDAVPANLDPLPPEESAHKILEYMGGAQAIIDKARASYAKGEFRWVAQVMQPVVFAEPDNAAARELLAAAYDQLGYQAESGPWRDVYLSGAHELRHGPPSGQGNLGASADMLAHVPLPRFLDAMALRIDSAKAEGEHVVINLVFTDRAETHVLELSNSVLHHWQQDARSDADATIRLTHPMFLKMVMQQVQLADVIGSEELELEGSKLKLLGFFSMLDKPDLGFPIVTP